MILKFWYYDNEEYFNFNESIIRFGLNGLCTVKFARDLIYYANKKENYDYGMELFYGDGDIIDYYEDDDQIEI